MIEQLERDSPDAAGQPRVQSVVISKGVDAAAPVVIEVVVDKDGPVSLELLTKLLIVGVVFLATRHIAPSLAIVGAILSAFIPDVITSVVRRRRWGKKRVAILAALFTFFAALDSAFAQALGRRMRRTPRAGRGGARHVLGLGHAMTTTAAAASVCAIAVAVPAIASGGSPFPASHARAPAPASHTNTPLPAKHPNTPLRAVTQATPVTPAHSGGSHGTSAPSGSHDRFVRVGVSPTGVPGSVRLAPGERVHLEFTLEHLSHVVLAIAAPSTLTDFNIWRDANQDGSDSIGVDSTQPYAPTGLLAAGTHTITIEPTGASAGTLLYTLYASTDLTQADKVSATGVPATLTVTPGQRAHIEFTLEQPSHVVFALVANSTLTDFSIFRDDDQDASDSIAVDSTQPYAPPALLAAGTHTITIEPGGASAGTLGYTLTARSG